MKMQLFIFVLLVSTVVHAGIYNIFITPEPTTVDESTPPPKIATISEATSQLDGLATSFQSLSVSTLSVPYTQ